MQIKTCTYSDRQSLGGVCGGVSWQGLVGTRSIDLACTSLAFSNVLCRHTVMYMDLKAQTRFLNLTPSSWASRSSHGLCGGRLRPPQRSLIHASKSRQGSTGCTFNYCQVELTSPKNIKTSKLRVRTCLPFQFSLDLSSKRKSLFYCWLLKYIVF